MSDDYKFTTTMDLKINEATAQMVHKIDDTVLSEWKLEKKDVLKALESTKKLDDLVKYLEDKIHYLQKLINNGNPKPYGEELSLLNNSLLRYQEILDKIKEIK